MKISNHDHSAMMASHWASVDQQQLEAEDAAQAKSTLEAIGALADSHADSRATIMGNSELSQLGQQSKIRALVDASDTKLEKISAPLVGKLQAKIHEATKAIANVTTMIPTVQDTLKHIEIRSIAAGMSDLDLQMKLESLALNGKDDQTVYAVLSASSLQPLLAPTAAARIRELMAARLAPDHTGVVDRATDTLATINMAIRTASHAIATPVERARLGIDALATLASGASIPRVQAPGA